MNIHMKNPLDKLIFMDNVDCQSLIAFCISLVCMPCSRHHCIMYFLSNKMSQNEIMMQILALNRNSINHNS